jgi:AbiU2
MKRDEFENQFTDYRKYLREEIHRFRDCVAVYRQIQERKTDMLEVINQAPAFFGVVEGALFTNIVLWGDKLFDEKGERGLFNFLTFVENNRKWLTQNELQRRKGYPDDHWMLDDRVPITIESIEQDRQKMHSLEALKSFRIRRDKFHAHFDKEYFFDRQKLHAEAPIRWDDLEEAASVMIAIINDYSTDFDGVSFAWDTLNIDDLDVLLRNAQRGTRKKPA